MFCGRKILAMLAAALLTLAAGLDARAAVRTWTDSQGRQIRAEFIRLAGGEVVLKRPSGKVEGVPLRSLSAADQQFIRDRLVADGVRDWTAIDGRQRRAKYLRAREGNVFVSIDGASISFPLEQLSIADRQFVRRRAEADGQADELPAPADDEALPEARAWTSKDGQKAVGQFDRMLADGRVLLAVDGVTRIVAVEQLSEADHASTGQCGTPLGMIFVGIAMQMVAAALVVF